MKLQLDYDTKQIKIIGSVNVKEFFDNVKNFLPDWKDWDLISESTTYVYNTRDIIIDRTRTIPWWEYQPVTVRYDASSSEIQGTYTLELN